MYNENSFSKSQNHSRFQLFRIGCIIQTSFSTGFANFDLFIETSPLGPFWFSIAKRRFFCLIKKWSFVCISFFFHTFHFCMPFVLPLRMLSIRKLSKVIRDDFKYRNWLLISFVTRNTFSSSALERFLMRFYSLTWKRSN